jgi:cytoskeleton protein RodZ
MPEIQEEKFSGQLLSEARKKRRLRYKRLSSELNIPEKYLQALEEENYEVMPGGDPYIKGYLRAYARKLGLDPDFIIDRYQKNLKRQKRNSENQLDESKSNTLPFKKYILFVAFFLVFFLFIYFSSCSQSKKLVIIPDASYEDKPSEVVSVLMIESMPNETSNILEDSDKKVPLKDLIAENFETEVDDAAIASEDLLQFYFLEDCWVSVESEFERLVYKLAKAGTSLEVNSKGPFKIIIGNANYATLRFNEVVINLLESSNRENNVSCVVLPSGKCSEFPRSK